MRPVSTQSTSLPAKLFAAISAQSRSSPVSSSTQQHAASRTKAQSSMALVYPQAADLYAVDDMISLEPIGASQAVAFSVLPELPAGLCMNPYTGLISGRPAQTCAEGYKITAWSDDDTSVACMLSLRIEPGSAQPALQRHLSTSTCGSFEN